MKKTTIIALIALAGCINVCSTVLFYQEVGRIIKEQLVERKLSVHTFSLAVNNYPTFNGLVEKVTYTIDNIFETLPTSEVSKKCNCSKRI